MEKERGKNYIIGILLLNSVMFEDSFHFSGFTEIVFVTTHVGEYAVN